MSATPFPAEEVAAVARGLTGGQASAFLAQVHPLVGDENTKVFFDAGLYFKGFYGPEYTPLGQAVAAYLREAGDVR